MLLSFCGNNCSYCLRYRATLSGSRERLIEVAHIWHRLGFRDRVLSPDEIACRGCIPEQTCRHGIAACGGVHEIKNCGECPEYPCTRVTEAFRKSEQHAARICGITRKEEYALLVKAFFQKRENLDAVHNCRHKRRRPA